MAFNIQRRTSDIANVVVADASRNVTLPADLTVTALVSAGLIKANAQGKLVAAVAGTDYQAPLTNPVTGTGTTNYIPKWTSSSALGNSQIFDNGTSVGINSATPSGLFVLDVHSRDAAYNTRLYQPSSNTSNYISLLVSGAMTSAIGYFGTGGNTTPNPSFRDSIVIGSQTAHPLVFNTSDGERGRITSGGNWLLGTSVDSGERLVVSGTSKFTGILTVTGSYINVNSNGYIRGDETGWLVLQNGSNGFIVRNNANNANYLTIADGTGAATFSSSVTADSLLVNRTASRNMLGISSIALPTSGDEEGVAVIKTNSNLWQLSTVGYAVNSKGVRFYNNGGAGNTAFEIVQSGPVTRFIVDGIGNIGVGVMPSAWGSGYIAMQIGGSAFTGNTTGDYTWVGNNWHGSNTGNKYIANGFASLYEQNSGKHAWFTAANNTSGAGVAITFTQAMTLAATGNLLVGTTTDSGERLVVSGDILATGSGNTAIKAVSTNNFPLFQLIDSRALGTIWNIENGRNAYGSLGFYNGGEKMLLTVSGNLGLGVTPSAWASNLKGLQIPSGSFVSGDSAGGVSVVRNAFYNGTNWVYYATGSASYYEQAGEHRWFLAGSGTANNNITFTQPMTLTANGRLLLGTTTEGSELLQVNGTMNVTGAATFSSSVTATRATLNSTTVLEFTGNGNNATYTTTFIYANQNNTSNSISNGIFIERGRLTDSASGEIRSFVIGSRGGESQFILNKDGNLGLGVTPSAWFSDFKAIQIGTGGTALSDSNGDATYLSNNWYYNTSQVNKYIKNGFASIYYQYQGAHVWTTAANNTSGADATMTLTERMRLTSDGKLGIATVAPEAKLHVAGTGPLFTIGETGSNAKQSIFAQEPTGNGYLYIQSIYQNIAYTPICLNPFGGLVGVNTLSPTNNFHIYSTASPSNVFEGQLQIGGNLSTTNDIYMSIGTHKTGEYGFIQPTKAGVGGKPLVLMNGGGNLLIGTTTDSGEKLQVNGSSKLGGSVEINGLTNFIQSASLPANTGGNLTFVDNYASPDAARIFFGDGTGWKMHFSKRGSSVTTDLFTLQDNGIYIINSNLILSNTAIEQNDSNGLTINSSNASGSIKFRVAGAERASITNTGAATFSSTLGINGVSDNVKSGTYTPTLTNVANISSSNPELCTYVRIDSIVTVNGYLTLTPTSGSLTTTIGISLPIASNFNAATDASGVFVSTLNDRFGGVDTDQTNDRVQISFTSISNGSRGIYFSFQYRIK